MDKQKDLKTIYLLKATSVRHLLCNTNLGALECQINKEENEYFITLDSVRLPKELNNELLKLYGI